MIKEEQRLRIPAQTIDGCYCFDFLWQLHALEDIGFEAYPYGGLSARVAGPAETVRWLTDSGGTDVPARKTQIRARWVAISNKIDDLGCWAKGKPDFAYAGLAIMDHPENPRHPTYWCGDAGCSFLNPCLVVKEPYAMAEGERLSLTYRVCVFTGLPERSALDERYKAFCGTRKEG